MMNSKFVASVATIIVAAIITGLVWFNRVNDKIGLDESGSIGQEQTLARSIADASHSSDSAEIFTYEVENIFLNHLESKYQIDMSDVAIKKYVEQFGGETLSEISQNSEKRYYKHIYDAFQLVKDGEDSDAVYQKLVATYEKIPINAWNDIINALNPELEQSILLHATRSYEAFVHDLVNVTRSLYRLNVIAEKACADEKTNRKLAETEYLNLQSNYQACKEFANKEIIQQIVTIPVEVPETVTGWEKNLDPLKIGNTVSLRINR